MIRATVMFLLLQSLPAWAGLKADIQNRLHVGSAWTPGSNHVQVGFDSRMSQSLFVDIGTFISPMNPTQPGGDNEWILRHGIFVDPGIRIPHRNKSEFKWDIILRGGFGPVWLADGANEKDLQISPALNGGADLMFRYKKWGLRIEGRLWYMTPLSEYEQATVRVTRPQYGSSVLYQF